MRATSIQISCSDFYLSLLDSFRDYFPFLCIFIGLYCLFPLLAANGRVKHLFMFQCFPLSHTTVGASGVRNFETVSFQIRTDLNRLFMQPHFKPSTVNDRLVVVEQGENDGIPCPPGLHLHYIELTRLLGQHLTKILDSFIFEDYSQKIFTYEKEFLFPLLFELLQILQQLISNSIPPL